MAGIAEFTIVIEDGPSIRADYRPVDRTAEEITSRSLNINPVNRRTVNFLIRLLREGRLKDEAEYEILGENLFVTLFYDEERGKLNEIGEKLTEVMRDAGKASSSDDGLLRITLDFRETRAELSTWPWEYLFSPERQGEIECNFFIAQRTRMALTRHLALKNVRDANPARRPLKVLLVAPSSDEKKVESSSVLEELQRLEASGAIELSCLPPLDAGAQGRKVTFRDFTRALGLNPHVIHFIGHGTHEVIGDRVVGKLAFTDETGEKATWVSDQAFANAIADNSQSVHLVFLQACETAEPMTTGSYQTIAGVAQSVSQKSVPAVVAMHYRVPGSVGNALAREFYSKLAEQRSVLLALNHARSEVGMDAGDDQGMWAAFGLPVLYVRGPGVIPDVRGPGVISDSRRPVAMDRGRSSRSARRLRCPWDDAVVGVDPDDGTCPMCGRTLICPRCQEWRGEDNQCVNCGHRIDEEADGPPLTVASRAGNNAAEIANARRLGGFPSGDQSPHITNEQNLFGEEDRG
jgi:CHAT domain